MHYHVFGFVPNGKKLSPTEYEENYGTENWDVSQTNSPLNSSIGILHAEKFDLEKQRNKLYFFFQF